MAEFDLTPKLTPYLDTHLVLPILNFLRSDNVNVCEKHAAFFSRSTPQQEQEQQLTHDIFF